MKLPVLLTKIAPVSPALIGKVALAGSGVLVGQWLLGDVLHLPGGGFSLLTIGAAVWWLGRGSGPPRFQPPETLDGWIRRCREVLEQFEALEGGSSADARAREAALQKVLDRSAPQTVAVVSVPGTEMFPVESWQQALAGSAPLTLSMAYPLAATDGARCWPDALRQQDVVVHVLRAPLMAADLLWLNQVPEDQPAWLVVDGLSSPLQQDLLSQLPQRWHERLLFSAGDVELRVTLQPLRLSLGSAESTLAMTRRRLLADLHRGWQADLEQLRRCRFQALQQRTQWIVATSVLASPVPSLDLLAIAVANGLMMREMADLWGCRLQLDVLREAAGQLARAALAQGVVEWSSQMLLGLAKIDSGSWLVAGAMQALSAAYLTRVVGRSMADWLAINAGVAEPDLQLLKQQAPLLVARAAEEERLDWPGFLQQSRHWLLHGTS